MGHSLGILEFGGLQDGQSSLETAGAVVALAKHAEAIGYDRFWLAEHHGASLAWASPELIVPMLGQATTRIRVGVAGILLKVYQPLKVANDFSLLSHLVPKRIDLGVAGGWPGPNGVALTDGRWTSPREYSEKVKSLVAFMRPTQGNALTGDALPPRACPTPKEVEIWLLGGSRDTARLAGAEGLSFGLAAFGQLAGAREAADIYRESHCRYHGSVGRISVALTLACAATDSRAERLLKGSASPARPFVIGSPETCSGRVVEGIHQVGADEATLLFTCGGRGQRADAMEAIAGCMEIL